MTSAPVHEGGGDVHRLCDVVVVGVQQSASDHEAVNARQRQSGCPRRVRLVGIGILWLCFALGVFFFTRTGREGMRIQRMEDERRDRLSSG